MANNLDELRSKVESLAQKITNLKKETPVNKNAIGAAVKELLDAKRTFAENNGGIGVDEKPFEEPLSKAEKKKRAKAEKSAAVKVDASGKQEADPNSSGAAKKAAKKAEAKAKKAALKTAAKGEGGAAATGKPLQVKATTGAKSTPKRMVIPSRSNLQAMNISINPNAPLTERPVAALTVACLTNTINDYSVTSDHKRYSGAALGLPDGRGELVGDSSIARYIARKSDSLVGGNLIGADFELSAIIDSWVDYANALSKFQNIKRVKAVAQTLDRTLKEKTYLVGHTMTLADIALFASLGFPAQAADVAKVESILGTSSSPTVRWMKMIRACPAVREATQIAMGIANDYEAIFDANVSMDPFVNGMNPLEGATMGNVVTRFPPEPSGYLHIGHAKAVLMNEYYARRYKGRLIVRFDDTNPSKEKEEFQSSIIEDLEKLGVTPDVVTFTSDYFETIKGYADYLIENGLAFMDDTPQEEMQKERMDRVNSKHRDQSLEDCKNYFKLLCSGKEEGSKWCLRAKINMQSVNGTMRDPVLFRQNLLPHHRSGTTYKAYPTYDLACPIVDSIEGVTHALRTTEYNDRDEQYQWIQSALKIRRVRIHAFARMNFRYTELSKRKLGWFVENNHVTGWDDARFPTIRGVLRRGVDIEALRTFICSQGASRRIVNMEWSKFWAENKKFIDLRAKRFMAIDKSNNVVLTLTNVSTADNKTFITTDYLPKDASFGKRLIRTYNKVLLEKVDTEDITLGENIVLMRWGVVKITQVEGELQGEYVPDGDFKKAKRKISWMAQVPEQLSATLFEFDNLISKEKLEEDDDFKDFINPNTLASSEAIGDFGLKNLQKNEIIQLERRGYYRVDQPYISKDKGLILFMIPDGKAKAMSGLTGKLAHR